MKSPEELKQLYGEAYVESSRRQSPRRLARLLKYMPLDPTLSVADFGCGIGRLMEHVAPRVKSYVGVDFSEPSIRAANQEKERLSLKNVEFVCSDTHEFCQQHLNFFDVGFAMDFAEHVEDTGWARIVRSIRRSLKPNGRLYLHTPNAEFFIEKMKSRNFILRQFPGHIAVRTLEHNTSLLREAGFKLDRAWLISHYNILALVHPLSFLPVIGRYLKARILIQAIA